MDSRIRARWIALRTALLALLLALGAQAALAVTVTRTPTSIADCTGSSAGGSGDAMKRVVKGGVISSIDRATSAADVNASNFGASIYGNDPASRATFGRQRGVDALVYRREMY